MVSRIVMIRMSNGSVILLNNRLSPWGTVVNINGNALDDPMLSIELVGRDEVGGPISFWIDVPKSDVVQMVHCEPQAADKALALAEFAVSEEQRLSGTGTVGALLRKAGL